MIAALLALGALAVAQCAMLSKQINDDYTLWWSVAGDEIEFKVGEASFFLAVFFSRLARVRVRHD